MKLITVSMSVDVHLTINIMQQEFTAKLEILMYCLINTT